MTSQEQAPKASVSASPGQIALALGALLVFISIFMQWFSIAADEGTFFDGAGTIGLGTFGGWVALIGVVLVVTGLLRTRVQGIGSRIDESRGQLLLGIGVALTVLAFILAFAGVGSPSVFGQAIPVTKGTGFWLLLVGAIVAVVGFVLERGLVSLQSPNSSTGA